MIKKIPKPIIEIIQKLEAAGFEAFVVGGCVRDLVDGCRAEGLGCDDEREAGRSH